MLRALHMASIADGSLRRRLIAFQLASQDKLTLKLFLVQVLRDIWHMIQSIKFSCSEILWMKRRKMTL
jgi:hypothetical protein